MSSKNIKLVIEYAGTNYSGWQSQDGPNTIQDEIQRAIFKVTGIETNLTAAGRTDAGVHALGQVANFHIEHRLEPERYEDAINSYLAEDILIKSSTEVSLEFNSRKSAIFRRYRYLMSPEKSSIYRYLRWHQPHPVVIEKLKEAAALVSGEHDFSSFCVTSSLKENNRCQIEFSRWFKYGPLLIYEIRGNRFLHGMVRSLVGSMINLSLENQDKNSRNLTLSDFKNMLSSQSKDRAVFTAPPHGLYLVGVGYPKDETK
ncbi:MAG TPA: tRNA pseudouridine(38-40) synthase TruA [candidate division Zixibacteria bacterium]|nr:tRNA pseudouridine(38-40) synthase TruA [candidate division Zixibacteria bacterium]